MKERIEKEIKGKTPERKKENECNKRKIRIKGKKESTK